MSITIGPTSHSLSTRDSYQHVHQAGRSVNVQRIALKAMQAKPTANNATAHSLAMAQSAASQAQRLRTQGTMPHHFAALLSGRTAKELEDMHQRLTGRHRAALIDAKRRLVYRVFEAEGSGQQFDEDQRNEDDALEKLLAGYLMLQEGHLNQTQRERVLATLNNEFNLIRLYHSEGIHSRLVAYDKGLEFEAATKVPVQRFANLYRQAYFGETELVGLLMQICPKHNENTELILRCAREKMSAVLAQDQRIRPSELTLNRCVVIAGEISKIQWLEIIHGHLGEFCNRLEKQGCENLPSRETLVMAMLRTCSRLDLYGNGTLKDTAKRLGPTHRQGCRYLAGVIDHLRNAPLFAWKDTAYRRETIESVSAFLKAGESNGKF
ncbi:MAG TPA: hypothetical protein VGE55_13115 [Limnobacter sp.]|uniref:hypothetical protein n=1 Tax=Limnobacter sp. TaxID=2003368 RepID=UPI002EDAC383